MSNVMIKDSADTISGIDTTSVKNSYAVIVYGGGLQAVAAAAKAARKLPDNKEVLLISPYPTNEIGGIATSGGQNYWDKKIWKNGIVNGGTFAYLFKKHEIYNTHHMSEEVLKEQLRKYANVMVLPGYDISKINTNSQKIQNLVIRAIERDPND